MLHKIIFISLFQKAKNTNKYMKIALIDNYDSFSYNLVHILEQYTNYLRVFRSDSYSVNDLSKFDKIVLSPGPGLPSDGKLFEILKNNLPKADILGVCLGHQMIVEIFGGKLINMNTVNHGLQRMTIVTDTSEAIFRNIPERFLSGRYHSWIASPDFLPKELKVTAIDQNGSIMSISHKTKNIKGVQFHPESILTPHGKTIIYNWIKS